MLPAPSSCAVLAAPLSVQLNLTVLGASPASVAISIVAAGTLSARLWTVAALPQAKSTSEPTSGISPQVTATVPVR